MPAHPPGWLRDPTGRHEQRYWDGGRWSEHVADRGITTTDAPVAPDGTRPRPGPRAGRVVSAAATAALGALAVGVVAVVVRGGDDPGAGAREEIGPVVELAATDPGSVTAGAGAVWVAEEDAVLRLDPATGDVTDTLDIRRPRAVAATDGALWVSTSPYDDITLLRVDPTTLETVAELTLPGTPAEQLLAVGPAGVWVVTENRRLVRIDPATNQIAADVPVTGTTIELAVGEDAAWVSSGGIESSQLQRVDADDGAVTTVVRSVTTADEAGPSGVFFGSLAAGDGGVWVHRSTFDGASLQVVDELCRVTPDATDLVCGELDLELSAGDQADVIAYGEGAVWVAVESDEGADGRVLRVDHESLEVTAEVPVPAELFFGIAAGEGAVWAIDGSADHPAVFKVPV